MSQVDEVAGQQGQGPEPRPAGARLGPRHGVEARASRRGRPARWRLSARTAARKGIHQARIWAAPHLERTGTSWRRSSHRRCPPCSGPPHSGSSRPRGAGAVAGRSSRRPGHCGRAERHRRVSAEAARPPADPAADGTAEPGSRRAPRQDHGRAGQPGRGQPATRTGRVAARPGLTAGCRRQGTMQVCFCDELVRPRRWSPARSGRRQDRGHRGAAAPGAAPARSRSWSPSSPGSCASGRSGWATRRLGDCSGWRPPGAGRRQPAGRPAASLTLAEIDAVFAAIGAVTGPGAQADRRQLLAALFARATRHERGFLSGCSPASCTRAPRRA